MKRKRFYELIMRVFFLLCTLAASTALRAADKPNILFLFADDQCHETIRALGHTDIDTPNLDRLVARGTTFTHAYNMGSWSGAVCVASRTMLVTGRTVWRAGQIYEAAGRTAAARAAHQEVLALQPDDAAALEALARLGNP